MRHTGDSGGVTSRNNYKSVIGETDCLTDYREFSNLFMDIGHTALFESQFGEGPWEVGLKLPLENDVIKIHEAGSEWRRVLFTVTMSTIWHGDRCIVRGTKLL